MGNNRPYRWMPGSGPDSESIARLRSHFARPAELMGEAWFMSPSRRMYSELGDPQVFRALAPMDVEAILLEISSGTSCFGHEKEWDDWFKYLLPDLIERSGDIIYWEQLLFQSVVTAFMSIFWYGTADEYEGFREDVLASLSVALMDERLWTPSETGIPTPVFLGPFTDGNGQTKLFWNAYQADANLSAAMFFCLKYLREDEIESWVESLTDIADPRWQGNLMVWLLGSIDVLSEAVILPATVETANPEVRWEASHVLGSKSTHSEIDSFVHLQFNDNRKFIPAENAQRFLSKVRDFYTELRIVELSESFSGDEYLELNAFGVPDGLNKKLNG